MSYGISSKDLQGVQRVDKSHYLASYLRDQQTNKKHYAAEGQAAISSWSATSTANVSSDSRVGPIVRETLGFDTPLLKPRAPRLAAPSPAPSSPIPIVERRPRSHCADPGRPRKRKKRPSSVASEEEHAARLTERRERKRAKQAIVKAPRSLHGSPKPSKPKGKISNKKSTQKEKIPPGFALMYGLNPTNVGAGRLTVKPPINIGVFSKGKASAPAQRKAKISRVKPPNHFSEHAFLSKVNKAVAEDVKPSGSSVSEDELESESGSDVPSDVPRSKSRRKGEERRKHSNRLKVNLKATSTRTCSQLDDPTHSLSPSNARPTRDPVESIIWDIEKDDLSLPSGSPRRRTSDAAEGTIIVNAHRLRALELVPDTPDNPSNIVELEALDTSSAVSLRPSESASRIRLSPHKVQDIAISRFFAIEYPPLSKTSAPGPVRSTPPSPRLSLISPSPTRLRADFSETPMSPQAIMSCPWLGPSVRPCIGNPIPGPEVPCRHPESTQTGRLPSLPTNDIYLDSPPSRATESLLAVEHLDASGYASLHQEFHEQVDSDSLLCGGRIQSSLPLLTNLGLEDHIVPRFLDAGVPRDSFDEYVDTTGLLSDGFDSPNGFYSPFCTSSFALDPSLDCDDWESDSETGYLIGSAGDNMHCDPNVVNQAYGEDDHLLSEMAQTITHVSRTSVDTCSVGSEGRYDEDITVDQDDCISEVSTSQASSLVPQRFYQGRALLLGLSKPGTPLVVRNEMSDVQPLSKVEKDVVKLLKGHWQPHKF